MDDEYCVGTRCASKCTNVFFLFFKAKNEKENGSFVFLLLFCSACRSLRGSSPLCETIHNLQDPINVFLPSGCTSVHVCTPVFPSYSSLQVASWNPSDFYCRYPGFLHNGASISKAHFPTWATRPFSICRDRSGRKWMAFSNDTSERINVHLINDNDICDCNKQQ